MELISPNLSLKSQEIKFVPSKLRIIGLEIASRHGLTLKHLRLPRRFGPLIALKNEFCYRMAISTNYSYSAIARFLHCDHTTVAYRVGRYCAEHGLPFPIRTNLTHKRSAIMAKAFASKRSFPRTYGKSTRDVRRDIERAMNEAALNERIKEVTKVA